MQGLHAEIMNVFSKEGLAHIARSRIIEGAEQLKESTPEERTDVLRRWNSIKFDLKNFYAMKMKQAREEEREGNGSPDAPSAAEGGLSPPRTGWMHTRHLSFEERKKLHARKDAWKKSHVETTIPHPGEDGRPGSNQGLDDEFERAIQASIRETSSGNAEEDAKVEQAMRASLQHMQTSGRPLPGTEPAPSQAPLDDLQITDEEYQELIGKAIQQSMALQAAGVRPDHVAESDDEHLRKAIEESRAPQPQSGHDDDEALRKAIEESRALQAHAPGRVGEDMDKELRKAIEESRTAHAAEKQRDSAAKTEEEIVMEYVKRQSLAEEELRRRKAKGKLPSEGNDDIDDEDLKRALEESLRVSQTDGAGPSSTK